MSTPFPTRFAIQVGGYGGPSYMLRGAGRKLRYEATDSMMWETRVETIAPSHAQWQAFWESLDEIGVWRWRPHYPNPGVLDGTSWSVDIAVGDKAVRSHGSNGYPTADGTLAREPTPTPEFRRFLAAVRALIGGRALS